MVLVAGAAAMVVGGSVGAGGQTSGSGGFGAAPAHPDPADPATRAYFRPVIGPGKSYSDEVQVTSTSDSPLQLLIAPVDGLTGQTSGAVYANRGDPILKAGAWVTPAVSAISLAPHAQQLVAFTVKVPADAVPGDHLAGVAVEDANPHSSGGQFAVTEVFRTVVGVDVTVPGPAAPGLQVGKLALKALPGTGVAALTIHLRDNGRKLVKPQLSVSVQGPGGYRHRVNRQLDTILPGDTIAYPFLWPDSLAAGSYRVAVRGTGGPAAVAITATLQLGSPLQGTKHPTPPSPSSSQQLWEILLALALALLSLVVVWRWSRRRQRQRRRRRQRNRTRSPERVPGSPRWPRPTETTVSRRRARGQTSDTPVSR